MSPLATWHYIAAWWDRIAAAAERNGDLQGLQTAEDEAAAARRMFDIVGGKSEGPAACLARLRGNVDNPAISAPPIQLSHRVAR